MTSVKRKALRVKLIILLLCLICFTLSPSPFPLVHADIEASGSVKAASTSSTLQQKIQALKDEVASKAAKLKLEVNKQLTDRMVSGQIIESSPSKIVVNTTSQDLKGSSKSQDIIINEYTVFTNPLLKTKVKTIELEDLKPSDFVISLGDLDDQNHLVAKKVIVSQKPQFNKTISWGTVSKIGANNLSIKTSDHQVMDFIINQETEIKKGEDSADTADIRENQMITVSSTLDKSSQNIANFIYIIPQGNSLSSDKKVSSVEGIASKSAIKK